jgi:D-alanyl-D-alanine carboxypeptidase (penicillin-binding protein 5/6)
MLFDLRSGRVLWSQLPARSRPIASLAKMMTAIIVAERTRPDEQVEISQQAISFQGSGVGNLPLGRHVRLETLLYGLLLPSGNDAAIALAEHVSGSVERFVGVMNAQARRLGLRCTHFSTPSGIDDRGNDSCPRDLAVMAREVMRRPRLARVVGSRTASFPFVFRERKEEHKKITTRVGKKKVVTDHVTVKYVYRSGRLDLYGHNPLMKLGYRGATGIKTGYTDAAGRCFVGTVRRGRFQLGVVLLHSPDPGQQAERLMNRAFEALHWLHLRAPL